MANGNSASDAPNESATPLLTLGAAELRTPARFDRTDWLSFGGTTAIAFAGFWFTLSPNLWLGDSGLFSVGAMYAGIPSTPGYPAWTLYSWLFIQLLPISNIAWRVAVGSAVATAVACGLVSLMVSLGATLLFEHGPTLAHLNPRERNWLRGVCGIVAGLVLAFSGGIWREAVVADFGALSVLFYAGVLVSVTLWLFEPERRRFLFAGFFLLGLLLTSSQEMIVALPVLIGAIMLADQKLGRDAALFVLPVVGYATALFQWGLWVAFPEQLNWPLTVIFCAVALIGVFLGFKTRGVGSEWTSASLCGICLFLGLGFYFYSPIASMTNPPVNWGYPRTVEGFFHVLRRGQFEHASPTRELGRYLQQLWLYARTAGSQFGWPQLMVSVLPFCFLRRMNPLARRWMLGLFAMWFGVGPLMIAELNPSPDLQAAKLTGLYFMASYVILAVWLGLGLTILGAWMSRPNPIPSDSGSS